MSVGINLLSMLLNDRILHDIDLKLEAVQQRVLSTARAVQNGQISIFEGFAIEQELQAKKHDLEAEREARKTFYERIQKTMKDNIKDSFSIKA